MNPSAPPPYSNPPFFTFLSPKPNFLYSQPKNPPLQDLSSKLSSLENLINLSNQTLHTLSNLNLTQSLDNSETANLIPCPFNSNHRIPPHSLFRHSLLCPSSLQPPLEPTDLLHPLRYPKTLKSSHQLLNENRFLQKLPDSDAELCFSLSDYDDFGSNFFYDDCPGVVSLPDHDGMQKIFTIPRFLAVECANFSISDREMKCVKNECFRMLPSELWGLRNEVASWSDYPHEYSYGVLCAIFGLKMVKGNNLMTWVIANSPRYGVMIDLAMRDHIFLLFQLCMNAILNEALNYVETLGSGNSEEGQCMNFMNMSFNCPILVQVSDWFASQLSILYGQMNGKFFAINMLRQCILDSASGLVFFPLERKVPECVTLKEGFEKLDANGRDDNDGRIGKAIEKSGEHDLFTMEGTVTSRAIFVSQVAAAVAALHERSLLEQKIKGLRDSQPLAKYQLRAEHDHITRRADDERKKRSNYRPIIDHDGLPRQQSSNQETSKTKTREELLAEERDYKRRRMSYRGKKVKRTTLQVMRDIIEEYMEEIKQAGGIGCFVKEADKGGIYPSEPPADDITMNAHEPRRGNYDTSSARGSPTYSRKQSNCDTRSSVFNNAPARRNEQLRQGSHRHNGYSEDDRRSLRKEKHEEDYSRSPKRSGGHGQSHKHSSRRREQDDVEVTRTRYEEKKLASSLSSSHDNRSSSVSKPLDDPSPRNHNAKSIKNRWQRKTNEKYNLNSLVCQTFGDRYDPSESPDLFEDDFSNGSNHVRPNKLYDDELRERSSGYPAERRHSDYHHKS